MEIYLVGGAVRDRHLGRPVNERDYVVVGATPDEMTAQGFRPVGKDFPVFLHPQTHEEYALARTERKTAPGYRGFAIHADLQVTLEEDLARRDLTINAMAETLDGRLIDPHQGMKDIEGRWLRHVSPAFAEDPVRILRTARFAARYHDLGFRIAPETIALMKSMVEAGEAGALVAERVWQELAKALSEFAPDVFFLALRDCGALKILFPEIDRLFGVPQRPEYHPEIDTGVHVMLVLRMAAQLSSDAEVLFAALTHDLGKGVTPPERWPSHHGHEHQSVRLVESLCERLRAPRDFLDLARLVARYHCDCHRAFELKPATMLEMLEALDAFRRPVRFEQFLLACESDKRGRAGLEDRPYPQAEYLRQAQAAASKVSAERFLAEGVNGPALGDRIRQARREAIAQIKRTTSSTK